MLARLLGLFFILLAIYVLGQNIYLTTNVYPYWWRGIAADGSILLLTTGIVFLAVLPSSGKFLGWIAMGVGILLVFLSSRVILNPTTLWQFILATASFVSGYQLLTRGRING